MGRHLILQLVLLCRRVGQPHPGHANRRTQRDTQLDGGRLRRLAVGRRSDAHRQYRRQLHSVRMAARRQHELLVPPRLYPRRSASHLQIRPARPARRQLPHLGERPSAGRSKRLDKWNRCREAGGDGLPTERGQQRHRSLRPAKLGRQALRLRTDGRTRLL